MGFFSAMSRREQVTFNEMMIMMSLSALH